MPLDGNQAEGTVDSFPNYDGSTEEPYCCRHACRLRCSLGAGRHRSDLTTERSRATAHARIADCLHWRSSNRTAKLSEGCCHIVPGPVTRTPAALAQIISQPVTAADAHRAAARWGVSPR
jgi:hypothetical protein